MFCFFCWQRTHFQIWNVFLLLSNIRIFTVTVFCTKHSNAHRVPPWCTFIEQWPTLMHQAQKTNTHSRSMATCRPETSLTWAFHDWGHKEEKVILFNYESRTCIIDVDIFPPFSFHLGKARRQEAGSSRVSEVRAFLPAARRKNEKAPLSGRRLLVAGLAEACRWLRTPRIDKGPWTLAGAQGHQTWLRSRRAHTGVSGGVGWGRGEGGGSRGSGVASVGNRKSSEPLRSVKGTAVGLLRRHLKRFSNMICHPKSRLDSLQSEPGAFTHPASISGCLQITQAIYLSKRLINTGAAKTQHKKAHALACALAHWCVKGLFARSYLPKTKTINQFQTSTLCKVFARWQKKNNQVLATTMFCRASFLPPRPRAGPI